MSGISALNLLVLSAIWGASFLFLRIAAPVLGAVMVIEYRVVLAALFLFIVAILLKKKLNLSQNWKHYLVLGGLNSALPFLLIAYAAETLSASLLSILTATSPICAALINAIYTRKWLPGKKVMGLLLGITGVMILLGFDAITTEQGALKAIMFSLAGSFCYGLASNYTMYARQVESFANAHGSMWGATVLVTPLIFFFPAYGPPQTDVVVSVILLGVVCSGLAYLMYFRLVIEVGPTSALTVTFLVPVFGVLWGYWILDEVIGWHTLFGALTVFVGTALVTGFRPGSLLQRNRTG